MCFPVVIAVLNDIFPVTIMDNNQIVENIYQAVASINTINISPVSLFICIKFDDILWYLMIYWSTKISISMKI